MSTLPLGIVFAFFLDFLNLEYPYPLTQYVPLKIRKIIIDSSLRAPQDRFIGLPLR
jgi:hypothetical protein